MSAMGGFETPILHGMNFYGIASKAIVKKFCNGDEKMLSAFSARFIGSVYPGETLVYKMWKEPGNIIIF
jgi:acyl dehydratase